MSFERFNLDPKIMSGVRALGYTVPTPIQLDSIPPIMEGNDVSMQTQVNALRRGADIVCACPGRLLDHVRRGTINLSKVEVLVLDEADHMFDMGFLPDIRAILKHLPAGRQTLLFSATMPAEINTLARDILHAPIRVQIGHTAPAETVSHTFYPVEMTSKNALLQNILDTTETGLVLVFTRTKQRSKRVAQHLIVRSVEHYLPLYAERVKWTDRTVLAGTNTGENSPRSQPS